MASRLTRLGIAWGVRRLSQQSAGTQSSSVGAFLAPAQSNPATTRGQRWSSEPNWAPAINATPEESEWLKTGRRLISPAWSFVATNTGTVNYLCLINSNSSSSSNTMGASTLGWVELDTPVTVAVGDTVEFATGDFYIDFSTIFTEAGAQNIMADLLREGDNAPGGISLTWWNGDPAGSGTRLSSGFWGDLTVDNEATVRRVFTDQLGSAWPGTGFLGVANTALTGKTVTTTQSEASPPTYAAIHHGDVDGEIQMVFPISPALTDPIPSGDTIVIATGDMGVDFSGSS